MFKTAVENLDDTDFPYFKNYQEGGKKTNKAAGAKLRTQQNAALLFPHISRRAALTSACRTLGLIWGRVMPS